SVAQEVGVLGREVRRASGDTRAYDWHAPVYSRQQLTAALAVRVSRPRATGQAAVHPTVVTTEEMAQRVRLAENRCNWAVPVAEPVVGLERELAVPPYALGVWLGDGHSASARFTSADPEVAALVIADGVPVSQQSALNYGMLGIQPDLRALGVLGDKHIPARYLRASVGQRRALLAGLLDTEGTVPTTGEIQFVVTSQRLA